MRERLMLIVAGGLVVVLGVDPGLMGAAWSSAAQAATSGVIDESRSQNLAAASATLDPDVPAVSVPLSGAGEDPGEPLVPLTLPADLPTAAETTADLTSTVAPGAGVPVELGGLSVTVAPVAGEATPERVSLKLIDQASTEDEGVTGVLLEVADASDTPAAGEQSVELTVAYDAFAGIGGGDWASRLQAMWVPNCDTTAEATPECRPVPLASFHDEATQTVTVTVPVNPVEPGEGAAPARLHATTTTTTTTTT
ncbi:hypothetical protein, partial [Agromyces sp. NPDC049794]|uniref:hypothetical protein n=1 Tax=unclassified Agromyces TaxID=2639701 RepID=UPI0033D248C6